MQDKNILVPIEIIIKNNNMIKKLIKIVTNNFKPFLPIIKESKRSKITSNILFKKITPSIQFNRNKNRNYNR